MAWSSPATWVAAAIVTAAQLNQEVRDNLTWLKAALTTSGITSDSALSKVKSARCGVRVSQGSDVTHTSGSDKTLLWDAESYDSDGFHSTSSNTHRITIPSGLDGTYLFWASVTWEPNASGDRYLWIENSGGTIQLRSIVKPTTSGNRDSMQVTGVLEVAAGDWYSVHVQQDSGSTLTTYTLGASGFGAWRLFAA